MQFVLLDLHLIMDSGGLAQTQISVNRDRVANNRRRDDAIEDLIRELGFENIFLQVLKARVVNSTWRETMCMREQENI